MGSRSLTPKEIGALVREARNEARLTQAELGEKIGASRYWVAAFERGKPRAELGLALKALRALRLVVSIEPKEKAAKLQDSPDQSETLTRHDIDLSSILERTRPGYWQGSTGLQTSIRPWNPNSQPVHAVSVNEAEKRKKK